MGFGWSRSIWDAQVMASVGLVMLILAAAWFVRKHQPVMSFFMFWYFIALLPEASFIPLADAVVGYRAYPAYVGLAVIAAMLSLKGLIWIWRRFAIPGETNGRRFRFVYAMLGSFVLVVLAGATIARNRDWRDEMTLWSDVIQKDPANPRAHMMLGAQFLNQENYENAKEMFDQAIRLRPGRSHAYVLRGYLNSRLNRDAEALADFDKAVQLDSRAPYAYFYRGELQRRTGEYEKALADYHAALKFQPFYTDAYLGIAMAHLEKQETAKAVEACTKLVELDPEDRRGYDCLGNLFMEQERLSEAVALYQQGTRRIPRDSGLWYSLGVAHEKNGNYQEAGDAFERAGRLRSEADQRSPVTTPLID
jgi:cytochrome c-type biogenesis protein CcmH/NrfG